MSSEFNLLDSSERVTSTSVGTGGVFKGRPMPLVMLGLDGSHGSDITKLGRGLYGGSESSSESGEGEGEGEQLTSVVCPPKTSVSDICGGTCLVSLCGRMKKNVIVGFLGVLYVLLRL